LDITPTKRKVVTFPGGKSRLLFLLLGGGLLLLLGLRYHLYWDVDLQGEGSQPIEGVLA